MAQGFIQVQRHHSGVFGQRVYLGGSCDYSSNGEGAQGKSLGNTYPGEGGDIQQRGRCVTFEGNNYLYGQEAVSEGGLEFRVYKGLGKGLACCCEAESHYY
ncbi:hypothetical protein GCM10011405_33350 [Rufibacter glacialis]|nr:hypothetical protein GCM10011405_33350 [Rufibacter glacialis]